VLLALRNSSSQWVGADQVFLPTPPRPLLSVLGSAIVFKSTTADPFEMKTRWIKFRSLWSENPEKKVEGMAESKINQPSVVT
jgi:hypothetical protein